MGYVANMQQRKRRSFANYKGLKLNIPRKASAEVLKKLKHEMTESGVLDNGQLIVPIKYDVVHVLKDGKLVSTAKFKTVLLIAII